MNIKSFLAVQMKKRPGLAKFLAEALQESSPDNVVLLEYPVKPRQRWTVEHPHQPLYDIINRSRQVYKSNLIAFLALLSDFIAIPEEQGNQFPSTEPYWINGWMPALDVVALYGFIVKHKPKTYIEVGSGNSTKFARKAISNHGLNTRIISIDPSPRAEIDKICDEIIRKPVEEVDLRIFDRLDADDILYVDNSHRVFMNSDVTTIFLDVFPRLKPGVLVEIHDVTIPYDYPTEWTNRYFSEQYLLATYLLAKGNLFDIILPNSFITFDDDLRSIMTPLWERGEVKNVETHGCSFWLRIRENQEHYQGHS